MIVLVTLKMRSISKILMDRKHDRWLLFAHLIAIAIIYLSLGWSTTLDIDRLTTDFLFCSIILWLLSQKSNNVDSDSNFMASFCGYFLLGLTVVKTISLYEFESSLIALFPFVSGLSLALIAGGFRGVLKYYKELFFAWFLFFPTGVIGHFIDKITHITLLNAKLAAYLLYYFGFDVASSGNEVFLSLPNLGQFKAIVDYPCAGVPMIILIVKLSLLLITCVTFSRKQQILIPVFSLILGFVLGVIRVCILTLLIPNDAQFNYWHGASGSQIFSTLAIVIFSVYCYCILQQEKRYV